MGGGGGVGEGKKVVVNQPTKGTFEMSVSRFDLVLTPIRVKISDHKHTQKPKAQRIANSSNPLIDWSSYLQQKNKTNHHKYTVITPIQKFNIGPLQTWDKNRHIMNSAGNLQLLRKFHKNLIKSLPNLPIQTTIDLKRVKTGKHV